VSDLINETHVLYRFFNATGQLLYVGITMNPPRRFKDHRRVKGWWEEVAGITVENYANRQELAAAERRAIHVERPLYNVVHSNANAAVLNLRETVSVLLYRCNHCGQVVTGSSGYIHVSIREAYESRTAWKSFKDAKKESGDFAWSGPELMSLPEPARWRIHHRKCDPTRDEDGYYFFEVGRADTYEKLLAWTAHLLSKDWLEHTDWSQFLYGRISREAQAC
jgi:hypothetical protein